MTLIDGLDLEIRLQPFDDCILELLQDLEGFSGRDLSNSTPAQLTGLARCLNAPFRVPPNTMTWMRIAGIKAEPVAWA